METTLHYTAFISYRHLSPDQEVAARLHRHIETFPVPVSLRQSPGQKSMGKVFRDREELPLSADLGGNIEDALLASDWLICICSPRYLESRWCLRELEFFMEKKGRERVLVVLLEGTPEESFPPLLRFVTGEDGNVRETEPLAADVRGRDLRESLKKLKTEQYRILAPMLGAGFDDLFQRQKRRRFRQMATAVSAAFLLLGAFLVYALIQNARIEAQRRAAARNECDLLIEKSIYYTAENRRKEAEEKALEALKVSDSLSGYGRDRIRDALASAVYKGDFTPESSLQLPSRECGLYSFSPDDSRILASVSYSSPALFDADTGELLWVGSPMTDRITSLHFNQEGSKIVAVSQFAHQVRLLDGETGEILQETEVPFVKEAVFAGEKLYLAGETGISLWDPDTGAVSQILSGETGSQDAVVIKREEEGFLGWGSFPFGSEFLVLDLNSGEEKRLPLDGMQIVNGIALSPDGEKIFLHRFATLQVISLSDQTVLWERTLGEGTLDLTSPKWEGEKIYEGTFVYRAEDGELLYELASPFLELCRDPRYLVCEDGLYREEDGSLYCAFPGSFLAADFGGEHVLIRTEEEETLKECVPGGGSQYRMEKYEGKLVQVEDWTEPKTEDGLFPELTDPYQDLPGSSYLERRMYVSPGGRFVLLLNDGTYIKLWDLEKGESLAYRIYEFTSGDGVYAAGCGFSPDGRLAAIAGGYGNLAVYDLESGRILRAWTELYQKKALSDVKFNGDGSCIMAADFQEGEFLIYSVETGILLYQMHPEKKVEDWGFDQETGDGILLYEDGSCLAADLFTSMEEVERYAQKER